MFQKLIKSKKGSERIGEIGLAVALVLAIPKMILGFATGSISVLADGVNNLMDSFVSILTMVGMRMSRKPMDKDHPYGHDRIEYITGFIISVVTAIIGIQFLVKSVGGIVDPEKTEIDTITRAFMILSIVLKSGFSLLNHEYYLNFKSTIFKANRQDALFDVVISTTVLVTSFFFANYPVLDSIVALIISLILLYSAYETLKDTISPLIGEKPSEEDLKAIEDALSSSPMITSIHNIYVDRKSMDHVFATADVEVDPDLTVREAHDVIERLTVELREKTNIDLVVHIEPKIVGGRRLEIKKAIEEIAGVKGVHDVILGESNIITVAVDENKLEKVENIKVNVLNRLKEKDDNRWIIETVVDFR